jgi:GNAT superfamily N-acetyltransferase
MSRTRGSRDSRGPLVVRPAQPEDARQIAVAHTLSWQAAYRGLVPDEALDSLDVDDREARWMRILDDAAAKDQNVLVAQIHDHVVGFATGGPCRDSDSPAPEEVYAIYVLPSHWREGAGAALMSELLQAVHADRNDVSLWVLGDNERARSFYARFGFVDDGGEQTLEIGGADLLERRMVRPAG